MNIELIPFDKTNIIPAGKYLVRTESTSHLKTVRYVHANVHLTNNVVSVDVNNQIVTHISTQSIS